MEHIMRDILERMADAGHNFIAMRTDGPDNSPDLTVEDLLYLNREKGLVFEYDSTAARIVASKDE